MHLSGYLSMKGLFGTSNFFTIKKKLFKAWNILSVDTIAYKRIFNSYIDGKDMQHSDGN